mmetsp:Transcript_24422/g.84912  ORF Transcript_24422/g.84912 Transcript_24422/m.84912 type:complete len:225 (+) Transcript_24422:620-1294(+)
MNSGWYCSDDSTLLIARAASRYTGRCRLFISCTRKWMPSSATMYSCVSASSATLASAPHAWRATSTSDILASVSSADSVRALAICSLFSSRIARLHRHAAVSRCVSRWFDRPTCDSRRSPAACTMRARFAGCTASRLRHDTAWHAAASSSTKPSCTSGRTPPSSAMHSCMAWSMAILPSAYAALKRVSSSLTDSAATSTGTAPPASSAGLCRPVIARLPSARHA